MDTEIELGQFTSHADFNVSMEMKKSQRNILKTQKLMIIAESMLSKRVVTLKEIDFLSYLFLIKHLLIMCLSC